jgi:hypothetical protein
MKGLSLILCGPLLAGVLSAAQGPNQPPQPVPEAEQGEGVSITVYNQDFVVVRQRRWMELPKGKSNVRFAEVAATIVPETVQFTTLSAADAARVLEQSYEFDLVNADKLLDRYIDREIAVVTRDGGTLKGKLLSFDDQQLVLQTGDTVDLVPRAGNIKDVQLGALPEGLLTRPTLVWLVDAKAAGKHLVKVAYTAEKMTWRVDYRARVHPSGSKMDLAGWVTVTNETGATFKDARVKLMAGDLNIVREPGNKKKREELIRAGKEIEARLGDVKFAEKSFGDYHLYELKHQTTIKDQATKQIELLNVADVPVTKRYVLPRRDDRVAVLLEFKNTDTSAKGLGIPLPKGPVRLFQLDQEETPEFMGEFAIGHTPKDEIVRLRVGAAFDLQAVRKVLAERADKGTTEIDKEVRLRNHTKQAVTIEVLEAIAGQTNWTMLKNSHPYEKRDVNTLAFALQVPANGESVLRYTIRYTQN